MYKVSVTTTPSLLLTKSKNLLLNFRIDLDAKNVYLRKARTNSFKARCSQDLLIRSSIEANQLDIKANGNVDITKKLGVPGFGTIESLSGSIHAGSIYGPVAHIGDIVENHDSTLENLKKSAVNIISHSDQPIELGSAHGVLYVQGLNAHINLTDVSNIA